MVRIEPPSPGTTPLIGARGFRTFRIMVNPADTDTIDERLDSVPWEHLIKPPRGGRRTPILIVAGAIVLAAVVASAARTVWPNPPVTPVTESLSPPVTQGRDVDLPVTAAAHLEDIVTSQTTVPADVVSEADLRAVDSSAVADTVSAYAEWFALEWFTVDGPESGVNQFLVGAPSPTQDATARSFVESATAVSVLASGPDSYEVVVVVRTLSAFGTDGFVRQPARAILVPVGIDDSGVSVLDVPSPTALPLTVSKPAESVAGEAPPGVVKAAVEIAREMGLPDEASIEAGTVDGLWRISMAVRDSAGIPWVTVVWLDDDGGRVPPPR